MSRGRPRIVLVGCVALGLPLAGYLLLSGTNSASDGTELTHRIEAQGVSIAYPPSWTAAKARLSGTFVSELAVGTFRPQPTPRSSCPRRAFQKLGYRDVLIMVWEMGSGDVPPRPAHFDATLDWSPRVLCSQYARRGTVRVLHFKEKRRTMFVWLVIGQKASAVVEAEAYRILDSIKVGDR